MIVLDYVKNTDDLTIVVPPFHTGHLGFIPGTEVSVGIMAPYITGPTHCEVVISPFHQDIDQMARISCTMKDDIGVVGRLVNSISSLGINIATQESSAINHLNHHTVNLLVDLSTSDMKRENTKESVIRLYSPYESLFPLHDNRYVNIFESIIAHCAEVIVWKDVLGKHLPYLQMSPLSNPKLHGRPTAKIDRVTGTPYHVKIKIPESVSSKIRNHLRLQGENSIHYMLLSDTDERNLRVFFPTPNIIGCLIHVGFYHNDLPGVLSEIIDAVAISRFNILTSLLRKETAAKNVWEVILHYKGDDPMPKFSGGEQICRWVAELITKNSRNISGLVESNVEVALPRYPKRNESWRGHVPITLPDNLQDRRVTGRPVLSLESLLDERAAAARALSLETEETSRPNELISLVKTRVKKGSKPTIFLSFPKNAAKHADLIREALEGYYEFSEYQQPDGEIILDEVLKRVLDSDYFIGIWHHDDSLPTAGGKFNISPWMPFEYGVAFAAKKQSIVIHSEKLDEKVWKRINPGVNNPEYTDIFFKSSTVDTVSNYCRKNFK